MITHVYVCGIPPRARAFELEQLASRRGGPALPPFLLSCFIQHLLPFCNEVLTGLTIFRSHSSFLEILQEVSANFLIVKADCDDAVVNMEPTLPSVFGRGK